MTADLQILKHFQVVAAAHARVEDEKRTVREAQEAREHEQFVGDLARLFGMTEEEASAFAVGHRQARVGRIAVHAGSAADRAKGKLHVAIQCPTCSKVIKEQAATPAEMGALLANYGAPGNGGRGEHDSRCVPSLESLLPE
jgi:hypothetical protein